MERVPIPRLDKRAAKCNRCATARISVFHPNTMLVIDFRLERVVSVIGECAAHVVFDWHCLVPCTISVRIAGTRKKFMITPLNVSGTRCGHTTLEIAVHSWTTSARDYYYGRHTKATYASLN